MKKLFFAIVAVLLTVQPAWADYPKPQGFVSDFAHVLSQNFINQEDQKLTNFQKQTTNEIAVVTVDTTGDQSIEDYSIGLAEDWKPGVSGKDNGVILLFAMNDHKMRIEVGCGLEGSLTDIQASGIIDDMRPYFRASQYEQGIDKGVSEVMSDIQGTTPQPCKAGSQQAINSARAATATNNTDSSGTSGILVAVLAVIVIIVVVGFIINALNSNSDDNDDDDDSDDDLGSAAGGFATGALLGGMSSSHDDDSDDDSDSDDSSSSSSSSSSDDDGGSFGGGFGGFSGGSFSGGGASGGW